MEKRETAQETMRAVLHSSSTGTGAQSSTISGTGARTRTGAPTSTGTGVRNKLYWFRIMRVQTE